MKSTNSVITAGELAANWSLGSEENRIVYCLFCVFIIIIIISCGILLNCLNLNPQVLCFVQFSSPSQWREKEG